MDLATILFTPSDPIQTHALVFLLGSLAVSSLSDLRRMAAQADFYEVWIAFTAAMFLFDLYLGMTGQLTIPPFTLKWILILAFTAVSTATPLLNISTMDVAALAALLSTLNPATILLTIPLTILANELLHPLLKKHGQAGAYPFLPTVLTVNLTLLTLNLTGGIQQYLGITGL
ncbi:MAG: hypothetical protein GF416_01005 [Candidatus Altiarchaeales archaeon]|nr:hypothetical protein [Candidatus Altiarchaeales archaeon]MBD3415695.1 hypothetical protein [Candidatus Altiarchaeales archaeon]